MTRRSPSPQKIALWRFEIIETLLDPDLTRKQRSKLVKRISKTPLRWPNGEDRRPSRATLYRWLERYRKSGLSGLRPKPRRDKGRPKVKLPAALIDAALDALRKDPEQSWTFLTTLIQIDFPELKLARSTLHRRVTAHPAYDEIQRSKKRRRRRRRFVASRLHQRWQCDAKGPFEVRLVSGALLAVHVITIIEEASRAVLAAHVIASPNLAAALRLLRRAIEAWGLPEQYYADRGSIFDARPLRAGLAELGITRIWTKPYNGPAHGKIEAYHRVLELWFVQRLKAQQVVDEKHLQQLLDGMIGLLYQTHKHRGLQSSPAAVLGDTQSSRRVARTQLYQAFLAEKRKKAHPTTGEVELQGATWIVPDALRGKRCLFLLDPTAEWLPVVVEPRSEERLPLRRAAIAMHDLEPKPKTRRWGEGPLQKLYDSWAGKVRPIAEPGFGLPELYSLLASAAGRRVPKSQREAALIQHFYRAHGPLPRAATERAFVAIRREIEPERPLNLTLEALRLRIRKDDPRSPS